MRHGTVPPGYHEAAPVPCPGGIHFDHPDFAMTLRMSSVDTGVSRFYYSYDRGHTWRGPFQLPLFGQPGIAARTDYIVNSDQECLVFLTSSKANNREGRVICGRTTDGGRTWQHVGDVGEEPKGFAIMPATLRIGPTSLLCLRRRREGDGEPKHRWIDAFVSRDEGKTWHFLNDPVTDLGEGNPPSLTRLADGRICLTYGFRAEPYSILARLSGDNGTTWEEPLILRDDGASRDIGYTRTVQRPDGILVTIYYFHGRNDTDRKVMATLWNPGHHPTSGTNRTTTVPER